MSDQKNNERKKLGAKLTPKQKSQLIFIGFLVSIVLGTLLFTALVLMRGPKPKSSALKNQSASAFVKDEGFEKIRLGQRSYHVRGCVKCHGVWGAGDGTKARGWPTEQQPRDLRRLDQYKQGSSKEEIIYSIKNGIVSQPQSAMPKYPFLVEEEYEQLALYLLYLQTNQRP